MAAKDDYILHNGVKVMPGWPERIAEAQEESEYLINGEPRQRVRYGDEEEDWGANDGPCGDCAVLKGQFHVPGCDVERCPACGGQVFGCDCEYEGDEDDE